MDEDKLFSMLDKIYAKVESNENLLNRIDSRLDILENGVTNNSIILETLQSNIKIMSKNEELRRAK